LGHALLEREGEYLDAALYPIAPWAPQNGFTVDPALVHAVMRQESKFDVSARSARGAMGLMQIMPTTARYVSPGSVPDLKSPRVNVKVGQDYLTYLLKDKHVSGDMMKLLVAYNAGPGNLSKWLRNMEGHDDPLLFIEMIPVKETREYVERVMASYWMYRLRDGKDVPSLRAVSRGEPAEYAAFNDGAYRLAMAGQ
jgi:soluble lytic murein transglycosylase-like protein